MNTSSMSSATTLQVTAEQRSMAGVYAWMVLGLGITGAVAWFAANTPAFIGFLQSSIWVLFGLFGVQLVVAIVLGMLVMRLPPAVTIVLFLVYSALTGLTISLFVLIYPIQAIVIALLVTAGIFGALSVYGFVTKRDLSGWGLFLFFGLLGLLLVSTINFFFVRSGWLDWALSVGGVLLFAGMTAYNTQQTKRRVAEARDAYGARQATIYGAFALYLNFINMFLRVLALTGRRR